MGLLSSNFFSKLFICFVIFAGASVADAQSYCYVNKDSGPWTNLEQKEASFLRAASMADRSCLLWFLEESEDSVDVDINAQDLYGNTALILLAGRPGKIAAELTKKIINHPKADITISNKAGLNVFDVADVSMVEFIARIVKEESDNFLDNVESGDVQKVKNALRLGIDPNMRREDLSNTALMIAVENKDVTMVEAILDSPHADINLQTGDKRTALMKSIITTNNFPVTSKLVSKRGHEIDINVRDINHRTALIHAAFNGEAKVVDLLLDTFKETIDVQVKSESGETALLSARRYGHERIVERLVPSTSDALHKAIEKGDIETVSNILVQATSSYGGKLENKDVTEMIMDTFATNTSDILNMKDAQGNTPLISAILGKNKANKGTIVELIASREEVDLNAINNKGQTFLMLVAQEGGLSNISIPYYETNYGHLDLNIQDNDGNTALMYAARSNNLPMAKTLLASDRIDISLKNYENQTALDIAEALDNEDVFNVISDVTTVYRDNFFKAAELGNLEDFRLYMAGNNVNARNDYDETALIVAAREGHRNIVSELLGYINIDVNTKSQDGSTALTAAIINHHPHATYELLDHVETAMDAFGKNGKTALMWAATVGNASLVKKLVEDYDADFSLRDKLENLTAFEHTVSNGHIRVVQAFLSIEFFEPDNIDYAIELADRKGHERIAELLKDWKDSKTKSETSFLTKMCVLMRLCSQQ